MHVRKIIIREWKRNGEWNEVAYAVRTLTLSAGYTPLALSSHTSHILSAMWSFVVRSPHPSRVQFGNCKTFEYYSAICTGLISRFNTHLAIFNNPQACFMYNPRSVAVATIDIDPIDANVIK